MNYGMGGGHMMGPAVYDEKQLIPTLPYYDLPAGLMVPLIPLEEVAYKPIDPKKIRLPPPTPPTPTIFTPIYVKRDTMRGILVSEMCISYSP